MSTPISAEQYLDIASQRFPAIQKAAGEKGNTPLFAYLYHFIPKTESSFQTRDDLFDLLLPYAGPLLGERAARSAISDLIRFPLVLTANHLGVEYFAQSFHSTLLFALSVSLTDWLQRKTVPVFSFGNVPLNNLTYPRGALIYRTAPKNLSQMPLKLPLFPDAFKRRLAGAVSPFGPEMIRRARSRLEKRVREGEIPPEIGAAMETLFREDYSHESVICQPDYSRQTAVLNRRIWRRIFSGLENVPELFYMDIEKITSLMLAADLNDPKSLAYRILFDPPLRKEVLRQLEGLTGCWVEKGLAERLSNPAEGEKPTRAGGCGTVFFWGIDREGRRIPLLLKDDASNAASLLGMDDRGARFEVRFTPEALSGDLEMGRLLPSLFTCFATLSFARGIACIGGYFQAEYLPRIQQGLAVSLQEIGDADAADAVAQVPADLYLSGLIPVMARSPGIGLIPAGPAEIIASRGLDARDMERICMVRVRDAHIAGLFETVPDILEPAVLRKTDWKRVLAEDCERLLADRVVVK